MPERRWLAGGSWHRRRRCRTRRDSSPWPGRRRGGTAGEREPAAGPEPAAAAPGARPAEPRGWARPRPRRVASGRRAARYRRRSGPPGEPARETCPGSTGTPPSTGPPVGTPQVPPFVVVEPLFVRRVGAGDVPDPEAAAELPVEVVRGGALVAAQRPPPV